MTDYQPALFDPPPATRWRTRHMTTVPPADDFDPREHRVVPLPYKTARDFTTTHHYSPAWLADVLRYGLITRATSRLVGTVVLSNPVQKRVLTSPFPTLTPYRQSLEVGRLVLLDEVGWCAESHFVAAAFRHAARHHDLRAAIAYADPHHGHHGGVYQALSGHYIGTSRPDWVWTLPDGTELHRRSANKITGSEVGAAGVRRRLTALGADPTAPLHEALDQVGAVRTRRPGKHRYLWLTGGTVHQRRVIARHLPPTRPYPKPDWTGAPR